MASRTFAGEPHPLSPSPSTRRGDLAARVTATTYHGIGLPSTLVGASLIAIAFFLPWLHGDAVFAMRTYSGFGLAGALHSVTTGLATSGAGAFAPLLFYALPAGAAGAALHRVLAGRGAISKAISLLAGAYGLALVAGVLALAMTPLSDASRVLGAPSWGLWLTIAGALLLLAGGFASCRDASR